MKKIAFFFCMCLFAGQAFSQIQPENPDQVLFRPATHSGNLKSSENKLQAKSFYQSKNDWQTIIDTTWGPGRPLDEKLYIFNTFIKKLTEEYEGFNAFGIDPAEWDSICASYRSRIDSSTSRGAFAALMGRLAYDLRDFHTHAFDNPVLYTPPDPGIPVLLMYVDVIDHFGAVLTVLPDSSLLVLRTIENHPLGLEPGDIVLGYEGVLWKDLVDELIESGIPILYSQRSAKSASRHNELASAGMNWHLFETIDIVKYASGDTVHLPVYPLASLPSRIYPWTPDKWPWSERENLMWNNEQLPVPGVPFPVPNEFDERSVTHGIVEGTNIGYIYLYAEIYNGLMGFSYNTDAQFYEAVKALSGTEGLIIDIRFNMGGWSLLNNAFSLLNNTPRPTLEDAVRCNKTDFSLCPGNNQGDFLISGNPESWYGRPIAILTGTNCMSDGDITAYRFSYLPLVSFFGKSICAALGHTKSINTYPEWGLVYSAENPFHVKDPNVFLNHHEFPVDDSVWFDKDGVANGEDAVVKKAMEWIQNLSYAHNVLANPSYVIPGTGTVTLTAKVENPNDHNLSVNAHITSMDSTITETIFLFDDGNHNDVNTGDGIWGTTWPVPDMKTIFSADITTEDSTVETSRTITGAAKFTSIGPVMVDGLTYTSSQILSDCGEKLYFKVALRNNDSTVSTVKVRAKLISLDTTLADIITDDNLPFSDIAPGKISTSSEAYGIAISEDFPVNSEIPVKVEISGDYYTFWSDTFSITRGPVITAEDNTICDGEQTNIDISSVHVSNQAVYYTYTSALDSAGAVTGNTSNATGVWEKVNIKDNLDNTNDQAQRIVYIITPHLLESDKSLGCSGTPITVDIWVEPTVGITAENDTIRNGSQTDIDISSAQVPTREVYYTYTSSPDNAESVTGNTSNAKGLPITNNIQDTLYNMTKQAQKIVYTITPHVLSSVNSIECTGTEITVDIWVDTLLINTEYLSMPMTRIYPNPADDIINIEIGNTGGQAIEIELLTVSGQVIYRREYKNSQGPLLKQIDLSGYQKGVYFVRIRQSGTVYNGKIIVM